MVRTYPGRWPGLRCRRPVGAQKMVERQLRQVIHVCRHHCSLTRSTVDARRSAFGVRTAHRSGSLARFLGPTGPTQRSPGCRKNAGSMSLSPQRGRIIVAQGNRPGVTGNANLRPGWALHPPPHQTDAPLQGADACPQWTPAAGRGYGVDAPLGLGGRSNDSIPSLSSYPWHRFTVLGHLSFETREQVLGPVGLVQRQIL